MSEENIIEITGDNSEEIEIGEDTAGKGTSNYNNLENKRTVMVVFGPENFMYWYGVLVDDIEVPTGLMKFELPKAEVAEIEQENQNLVFFNLPLNGTMPEFIHKIVSEGIEVYQNIGDSETPYVTWDLDMDTKKLTQDLYLKVSE